MEESLPETARPRSLGARRAALALWSTALALALAELAVRLLGIAPARHRMPRTLESEDKRAALDLYPDDPRGAFPLDLRDEATLRTWAARVPGVAAHAPHLPHGVPFRYTAELCRGADPSEARPRVLVLGDSFTEGQGVEEAQTFVARLDARLDAALINCGRRGYDFPELSSRFDSLLDALAPDVVLYAMVLNDPVRSPAFDARQRFLDDWILDRRRMVSEGDGAPPPAWSLDGLRLAELVSDRLEGRRVAGATTAWYREMVGAPNRAGWEETIERVASMAARMEGRFVVALWPLLVELDDYPFADTHRTIGAALSARGIAFTDALPAFEGADASALWVHPADRHPNAAAHRRFADAVEPALSRALAERP